MGSHRYLFSSSFLCGFVDTHRVLSIYAFFPVGLWIPTGSYQYMLFSVGLWIPTGSYQCMLFFMDLWIPTESYQYLLFFVGLWILAGSLRTVPEGSPSRGGDVAVDVIDINQPSLPTPFSSVVVSISVFMTLSTVFHSIHFPEDSPLSHSVLPRLISALLVLSTIYLFMTVSFDPG